VQPSCDEKAQNHEVSRCRNVVPVSSEAERCARLLRSELIRYCAFKGYAHEEYFRA
jgi:hypothetical protein